MTKFSIVTNASAKDASRLSVVLPHWLTVFAGRLDEICVLVDGRPAEGRISRLHATEANLEAVIELLDRLAAQHPIVQWQMLDYDRLEEVSRQWWIKGTPIRCQDGSPVFAFAASMQAARGRFVLRADCDMLFQERGWVDEALHQLSSGAVDFVSPPRLGFTSPRVSSRALLFDWPVFRRRFLPMPAAQLDWLRRIHRWAHGRPTCLAFEDSLLALAGNGSARFGVLPPELGASMHIARVSEIAAPNFVQVLLSWQNGYVPGAQIEHGWDYLPVAWERAAEIRSIVPAHADATP